MIAPFDHLAHLVIGELRAAPHLHTQRLGAFPAKGILFQGDGL
jgi:hypothetical protein